MLCFFPSLCNISFMLLGKMCLHVFLFVFPKVLFNSAFFISWLLLNVCPAAPSSKALCSSHDFAVRVETSTDGCGNAGCTQQTFRGEIDGMWVVGMWVSDEMVFFLSKKKQEVLLVFRKIHPEVF